MAVCTLATVILPFTLLALMYPMRWFQHCIVAEVEGGGGGGRLMHVFADFFLGMGTCDYQYFTGFYLIVFTLVFTF